MTQPQVSIALLWNSIEVLVGSQFGGEVDMADVNAFGNDISYVNAAGVLGHEIREQVLAQRGGLLDSEGQNNHDKSITGAENPINGSIRMDNPYDLETSKVNYKKIRGDRIAANGERIEFLITNGNMNIKYEQKNIVGRISINISNNNITSVIDLCK